MNYILQPHVKMSQRGMMRKLNKSDFWTITGEFIYRHHVEPRVKLYLPREEAFPIPLKYTDVTRTTHASLDVLIDKHIERLLERGWRKKRIVRFMDRIHNICSTKGKDTRGIYMVGRRLTRKQDTSRPDDVWPDMWKFMSCAAKKKAKQRWAIEKPKLDNARQFKGIFFIEPNDKRI